MSSSFETQVLALIASAASKSSPEGQAVVTAAQGLLTAIEADGEELAVDAANAVLGMLPGPVAALLKPAVDFAVQNGYKFAETNIDAIIAAHLPAPATTTTTVTTTAATPAPAILPQS